ncbi:hypothetical protein [Flavobacterium sp. '19STA2R22 D10 B1']|uniref:hypothetical protein n=1 Tax=Flavobacterium aerium TaxID=3037261 RepID=UPI00278C7E9B|nr:hypothetical protein [Flavobacterium sp. '19STA2R22 D10 B1']
MTVTVLMLQNWTDLSIQYTGNSYNAFEIAMANNRSMSNDLIVGESILIPDNIEISSKALQYLKARNIQPATGFKNDFTIPTGIGSMIIEDNFIVS